MPSGGDKPELQWQWQPEETSWKRCLLLVSKDDLKDRGNISAEKTRSLAEHLWVRLTLYESQWVQAPLWRMRTISLGKLIQLEDDKSGKMLTMESVFGYCHWLWRPYLSASSFFLSSTRDKVPRVLIWKDLVPCSSGTGLPFGFWGLVKYWMLTKWLPLDFPHSRNPRSQSLCLEQVPIFVWEIRVALSAPQIRWLPAVIGGWILSLSLTRKDAMSYFPSGARPYCLTCLNSNLDLCYRRDLHKAPDLASKSVNWGQGLRSSRVVYGIQLLFALRDPCSFGFPSTERLQVW